MFEYTVTVHPNGHLFTTEPIREESVAREIAEKLQATYGEGNVTLRAWSVRTGHTLAIS